MNPMLFCLFQILVIKKKIECIIFQDLLGEKKWNVKDCFVSLLQDLLVPLSSEAADSLCDPISNAKIKDAMFSIGNEKALGRMVIMHVFTKLHGLLFARMLLLFWITSEVVIYFLL